MKFNKGRSPVKDSNLFTVNSVFELPVTSLALQVHFLTLTRTEKQVAVNS